MIIEDDYAGGMRVPCDIFLMISHKIAEIEEEKKFEHGSDVNGDG